MEESSLYFFISMASVVLAFWSVLVAKKAMNSGLTYSAWQAVIYTLLILAFGRLWHTGRELFAEDQEWAEFVEYGLFIIAYVVYIVLGRKAAHVKRPFN